VLKLNIAEETDETNPFVDIWSADRPIRHEDDLRPVPVSGAGRYTFFLTVSCLTAFLGLLLAGFGLFQITRPSLSLPVGISVAGVGGTVVVASCVLIQMMGSRLRGIVRRGRRVAAATSPH